MVKNVYIINRGCHDYSKAEKFGNLIYLSDGSFNLLSTGRMYRRFYSILKDSHEEDYILPTGLTIMGIVAGAVFASIHHRLNLLIYYTDRNGNNGRYKERTIIMEEPDG